MKTKTEWDRTANGRWSRWLPCGSRILVEQTGAWDLTLPSGRHRHGQSATVEEAKADAMQAYASWAFGKWMTTGSTAGAPSNTIQVNLS